VLSAREDQRLNSAAASSATLRAPFGDTPSSSSHAADKPAYATIHCKQPVSIQRRRLGNDLYPSGQAAWRRRRLEVGVAEQVGVVEAALSAEALGVDHKPAARAEVEDVAVVDVSVQYHHVPLRHQQFGRSCGAEAQEAAMRGSRRFQSFQTIG